MPPSSRSVGHKNKIPFFVSDSMASCVITLKSMGLINDLGSGYDSLRLKHVLCKSKNALSCEFHWVCVTVCFNVISKFSYSGLSSLNRRTVYDSFRRVPGFRAKCRLYMKKLHKDLSQYAGQENMDAIVSTFFTKRICDDMKLRLTCTDSPNLSTELLYDIIGSKFCSVICNAEAYYRLGLFCAHVSKRQWIVTTIVGWVC